jgi:hypothetical protein
MRLQSAKLNLENEFEVLKHKIAQTKEAWNDTVQRRFYAQFLDDLPKEFRHYMDSLTELKESFEKAERIICEL